MKLPCSVVSVYKAELEVSENLKNVALALEELKNLNVPVLVGHVGFGPKEGREVVFLIPETHSHMRDSLVLVYNQSTYLKCAEDGSCSVVSVLPEGPKETPLGSIKKEKPLSSNDYTLLVGGTHYAITGL